MGKRFYDTRLGVTLEPQRDEVVEQLAKNERYYEVDKSGKKKGKAKTETEAQTDDKK